MSNHEESQHQQAVIEWSKYFDELKWLYAIPNGAHLAGDKLQRIKQMQRMKKEGLKVGVFDLFLPVARNGKHGLYIEMKRRKGHISKDQKDFGGDMASEGYAVAVCYSADEAIEEITEYMNLRGKR